MSGSKKDAVTVNVRALHREGYDGFWRGGLKWSSGQEGTTAKVTPALLQKLHEERMLSVREVADTLGDEAVVYDVPKPTMVDEAARELELQEAEKLRLDAHERAVKLKADNDRRRKELDLPDPSVEEKSKANQAAATAAAAAEARGHAAVAKHEHPAPHHKK